jgi:predicted MFS family arabinose efflux permease
VASSPQAAVNRGVSEIKHRRRNARFAPLRHEEYRRLWIAGGVSDLGDAVGRIALTIHVQASTGSAVLTGSVVALSAAPHLGLGQWLTARLARSSRRRVLVTADLVRAAAFLAMTLPVGVPGRLALLLVASVATPPFDATAGSLVPRVVPPALVGAANGLRTATTEAAFVVGFALGGLLADAISPIPVLAFNGASFLVSAAVLARMGPSAGRPVGADVAEVRFADGFAAIRSDPIAFRAVALVSVAFAFALVPETLVATFVDEALSPNEGLTGLLASAVAVTVVATALLLARPDNDRALVRQAAIVICIGGVAAAISFAVSTGTVAAVIGYLAIGPMLATRIHCFTVLGHRIEDRLLAPAMSVASGTLAASYVVAGLGGGGLAQLIGVRESFVLAGGAAGILGLVAYLGVRRTQDPESQLSGARLKPTEGVRSSRSISAASDG